jgi:hypothetical protein
MAYEIELEINHTKKKYIRNEEPMLHDMNNALKVQRNQMTMWSDGNETNTKVIDENEALLAQFAVDFWHAQFTKAEVINGANIDAVNAINTAIEDALGTGESTEDTEKEPKKSPSPTTTKP